MYKQLSNRLSLILCLPPTPLISAEKLAHYSALKLRSSKAYHSNYAL